MTVTRALEIFDLSVGPILVSVIAFSAGVGWGMPRQWAEHASADMLLLTLVSFLIASAIVEVPSIAAWHRKVLDPFVGAQTANGFRIGLPEFSYLWHAMFLGFISLGICLIVILVAGCVVAAAVASNDGNPLPPQAIYTIAVGGLAAIAVGPVLLTARLALVLPARAASHDLSFEESWRYTAGNTCRITFAIALSGLPHMVVILGLYDAVGSSLVRTVMIVPIWHLSLFPLATTLSLIYRHLVEGEGVIRSDERAS